MQNIFLQEVEVISKLCSLGTGAVAETGVERRLLGLAAKCGQMSEQVMCSWFGVIRSLAGQKHGASAVDLGLRLLTNTLRNCAVGILVSRFAEYLEYLLSLMKKFAGSADDNLKLTLIATNTIFQRTSSSVCAPSSMEKTKYSMVSKVASFVFHQGLIIKEQSIISLNLAILLNIITYFPHTLRHQLQYFKALLLNLAFEENQLSMKNKFEIAKIITKIPSVQGQKQFADAWNELFYGTLKSFNRLLSVIFLDVKEGEFNRLGMVISELLDRNQREVELITPILDSDKSGGINIVGRKIFICMHLMEGLLSNSSMEAAVQVPVIAVLQLLERCLLMNDLWSEVSQVKQVQVMSILPVIYTTALRLSMVVLHSSGGNAIMHYVTWAKCLKIQLENSGRLDAKQRQQLFQSSSEFLKLAGPGAVVQIYSAVFKCVIQEFILSQEAIQKSYERPKKKQKLQLVKEVEQQQKELDMSLQFKSEVETKVCVLKLLQTSIDFGATLLDQQICLMRSALVIKLFQYCWKQFQDDQKYGNDVIVWKKLLGVLMEIMVCEVQRETRYQLPYVSVLMFQLKAGVSDSDEWYSKFCIESLQSLENCLHPRSTSVFFTMENCTMENQKEEVEKQFNTVFVMEDFSQHDQVQETCNEKTQPEKEVQKDNHFYQENGGEHQQINIFSMQGESPSKQKSNPVNKSHEQGQVFFVQQVAGSSHPTTWQEISVDKRFSPDNLMNDPIYQHDVAGVDYIPATQEEHTQEHNENHQEYQQTSRFALEDNLQQSTEDDQLQQMQVNLTQKSGVGNFSILREEQQRQSTGSESMDEEDDEDDDELPEIDSGLDETVDDSGGDQDMEVGEEEQ